MKSKGLKKALKIILSLTGVLAALVLALFILWRTPYMKQQIQDSCVESTEGPVLVSHWDEFPEITNDDGGSFYCYPREGTKSVVTLSCSINQGSVKVSLYKTPYTSYDEMIGRIDKSKYKLYELIDEMEITSSGIYTYEVSGLETAVYDLRITAGSEDTSCCVYAEETTWLYRREYIMNKIFSRLGLDCPYET